MNQTPAFHLADYFPVTDPTWIFFLVLCIILFAPLLLRRLKIPHIIGLIIAGVLVGPHGFNILVRDSSFELFGIVGIYYIMFLAGLEMDLEGFKQNRFKSLVFGTLTTVIPFAVGMWVGPQWMGYGLMASVLISCILTSHTLVSYPIVGRYGLSRNSTVAISIGGTMVAEAVALLVLAGIAGIYRGDSSTMFWVLFVGKCALYLLLAIMVFPRIARWFFRHYNDNVTQFIFVLSMLFLSAALSELAGLEGIFGAFVAGLVLNRLIPHVSPLMNRVEFVGNAIFIPYFLIGVGMLINIQALFNGGHTLKIIVLLLVSAIATKWVAAWITQKLFGMKTSARTLMFGLSSARAAGGLAMVMVGTKIEVAPGEFLINDDVMNGMVILILVSCIISSLATERACHSIAMDEANGTDEPESREKERILITLKNPDTVEHLVNMALMIRNPRYRSGLIGLSVVYDNEEGLRRQGQSRKNLERAQEIATAVDVQMQIQSRVSNNISSGIIHAAKEFEASEIVLGLHHKANIVDSFLGNITQNILQGTFKQVMIVKCLIPVNTLRRIVVAVPEKAEYEAGFYKWVGRLGRLAEQIGCRIHFWGNADTLKRVEGYMEKFHKSLRVKYLDLDSWDDLLLLTGQVNYDHLLVIVTARKGSISYQSSFEHLPEQIQRYFSNNSLMMIYPDQYGDDPTEKITFIEPRGQEQNGALYKLVENWFYKWFK